MSCIITGGVYDPIKASGLWITDGNVVLLLMRSQSSDMGGTWGLPGGHLEDGENPLDAAFRETSEEAGYVPPFYGLGAKKYNKGYVTYELQVQPKYTGWKPKLNDEHTDYKWATVEWINHNWDKLHPGVQDFFDFLQNPTSMKTMKGPKLDPAKIAYMIFVGRK